MKRLVLMILLAVTIIAQAKEQAILTATNDDNSDVEELVLRLDAEGGPTHLLLRNPGRPERSFTTDQVRQGVVLKHKSGRDVVTLQAGRVDLMSGSQLTLRYLFSGVPPERFQSERLWLRRVKESWRVFREPDARPLTRIHFQTHRLNILGTLRAVGIRRIRFIHE